MGGQKMYTINKNLAAFDQSRRANDDRLGVPTVNDGTRADRHVWLALANLVAAPVEKWAFLSPDDASPISVPTGDTVPEQLDNVAHNRLTHLS
jgi:hypothetical protein